VIKSFIYKIKNDQRSRKVFATFNTAILAQAIQVITAVVSVPLTLNYLGKERFGLWMTISTFLSFINFSDFGIGIGYQNGLSKVIAGKNYSYGSKLSATVWAFVLVVFSVIILCSIFLLPHIQLSEHLKLVNATSINEVLPTTQMVLFILSVGILSGIVQRIYDAFQLGYRIKINNIISRLLSLALLFVAVYFKSGLPILVFVIIGINDFFMFALAPSIFKKHNWLIPRFKNFDYNILKSVLKKGIMGMLAVMAFYLLNSFPPIIISNRLNVAAVTDYSILNRMISIPTTLITFYLLPLWPAYSDAYNHKDYEWIKRSYKRNNYIVLGYSVVVALTIIFGGKLLIKWWLRNSTFIPDTKLILCFVSFMVLAFWNAQLSVILNALSKFKSQAVWGLILGLLAVVICYSFAKTLNVQGIVIVISIALGIRCLIMRAEVSKVINNELSN
jgi:O-antigen/teichoic acid export membrane protein